MDLEARLFCQLIAGEKDCFVFLSQNINVDLYNSYQESSIIKCKNKLQQILISQHPNEKMEVLNFLDQASQILIQETYFIDFTSFHKEIINNKCRDKYNLH